MYVGIEKSSEYKLSDTDKQFVSSQIIDHLVGKEKAARLLANRGFAAYYDGDTTKAMSLFNKAWLVDSGNPDIYWGYTLILRSQGQFCNAITTMDLALSKGRIKAKFLSVAAFIYSACTVEDGGLSAQQKASYIEQSDRLFVQAMTWRDTNKEQVLSDWIKALSARGDDIAAMDKLLLYAELTGHTLKGENLDALTDKSGSIMGFTPFNAPSGYGIGTIIDYGYTGLKHRLLFDPAYIVTNASPEQRPAFDASLRAKHKKSTLTYNDKEKRKLLNTIKQQLLDHASQLSVDAKAAIHKMVDIEISYQQAEHLISPDHKHLQYNLIQALPSYGGVIRGFAHSINTAKKPLVIIGVDRFKKARITVHFDKSVTQDAKFEILDNVHFETVGLRLDASGGLSINYSTPNIVVFRAVEFDKDALRHYINNGQLP